MKKLLIQIVCLNLTLVVTMGSVVMASSEQICLATGPGKKSAPPVTNTSCTKQKVKKPVNAKTNLNQKRCITAKQCQKLPLPAVNKPSSIKLPVLFPVTREVAFQGKVDLPADALPLTGNTSFSHFLAPSC